MTVQNTDAKDRISGADKVIFSQGGLRTMQDQVLCVQRVLDRHVHVVEEEMKTSAVQFHHQRDHVPISAVFDFTERLKKKTSLTP